MQYWFDHPDAHTKKVASHFDISVNNAWTRKHRLIKKLNECYREKSKL
jgi:DNA-directed RNA polymerase specialized sigma24 family protein